MKIAEKRLKSIISEEIKNTINEIASQNEIFQNIDNLINTIMASQFDNARKTQACNLLKNVKATLSTAQQTQQNATPQAVQQTQPHESPMQRANRERREQEEQGRNLIRNIGNALRGGKKTWEAR